LFRWIWSRVHSSATLLQRFGSLSDLAGVPPPDSSGYSSGYSSGLVHASNAAPCIVSTLSLLIRHSARGGARKRSRAALILHSTVELVDAETLATRHHVSTCKGGAAVLVRRTIVGALLINYNGRLDTAAGAPVLLSTKRTGSHDPISPTAARAPRTTASASSPGAHMQSAMQSAMPLG